MLSAIHFKFDQSKILSSGNGLRLLYSRMSIYQMRLQVKRSDCTFQLSDLNLHCPLKDICGHKTQIVGVRVISSFATMHLLVICCEMEEEHN